MEIKKNNYIYYQINSNKDYYVFEFQKKEEKLTKEKINKLLINDGFNEQDIILITSYEYSFKETEKKNELKDEILLPEDFENLYLYLTVNEGQETSTPIQNEIDIHQSHIEQLKKEIDDLSRIDKSKINFNNNKNLVNQDIDIEENFPKIYGLNQNINNEIDFSIKKEKNENKPLKIYYLYSYPLIKYENNNKKQNIRKSLILNNNNNDGDNENKTNEVENEDYIYYEQIYSIYQTLIKYNIYANLNCEPINENFNGYLEEGPDILHIKVDAYKKDDNNNNFDEEKLFINLDLMGILDSYSCENIKESFLQENKVKEIKLLIFSSKHISEMEKMFKKVEIQNIIYINSSKENEEKEKQFIKSLYSSLLMGCTIKKSFEESKNKVYHGEKEELVKLVRKDNNYEISLNLIKNGKVGQSELILNKNSSLNLDYMKYNYKTVIGRNKDIYDCITHLKKYKKLCVYGYEGVGKKAFIQKVGYFLYERMVYDNVYYLELYSFNDMSKKILQYKLEEIKYILKKERENNDIPDFEIQKVLIIIYFNFIMKKESLKMLEQIINESNKNFTYIYAFTIWPEKEENEKNKKIINTYSIELKELNDCEEQKLLRYLLKKDYEKKVTIEESKKNPKNPNDIYLKALFINLFNGQKEGKYTKREIFLEILEYKKEKIDIKKIFCIFTILKYGITEDIIHLFFTEENIEFIKKQLNYIIFVERNKNETLYIIDKSYIKILINILLSQYQEDFIKNIELVIKQYALIFRYLVKNSKFPYDISSEFHAGINNEFWQNNNLFQSDDEEFEKDMKKKEIKEIYFDDVVYSNNLNYFLNYIDLNKETTFTLNREKKEQKKNKQMISALKKEKKEQIANKETTPTTSDMKTSEYLSQISICLPTILYFKKSFLYRDLIIDTFINAYYYLNFDSAYEIRLKILKYWATRKFYIDEEIIKYIKGDKKEDKKEDKAEELYKNETCFEYYLFRMYICKKQNDDINYLFGECQKYNKNYKEKNFNLARLYFLKAKNTNDKSDYITAKKYAKDAKNIYLELISQIMIIKDDIINGEFDKYEDDINSCEKILNDNKNDLSLINSDIDIKIADLITFKNDRFNNYIKNKLFFFISNPFFDENGKPLKTQSNNSFFLKYRLTTALPGIQFEFQNIDKDLENLKKCTNYPIRFLYIGSDYYNEDGNLFCEDKDLNSVLIKNKDIETLIDNSKFSESCEILIIGITNCMNNKNDNSILDIFKNKFRHIIYINYPMIRELLQIENHFFYFYFQKCFFIFIEEFILNLSKLRGCLTIKEAFNRARNLFLENFTHLRINNKNEKLLSFQRTETEEKIIDMIGDVANDNDIYDFGYFNEDIFRPYSKKKNIKDVYDEYDDDMNKNNIYFRKNPFKDDEQKEEKIDKNKNLKYFKFPADDFLHSYNFKRLVDKRFYSMKEILRDLIFSIKKHQYVNVFGDREKFKGKVMMCEEVCKYFYMNNYFKKGIFVVNAKYLNKFKTLPEIKYNNNKEDMLIVIEHVEKIKNDLFEFFDKIKAHLVIISNKKLDNDMNLDYNKKNNKNKTAEKNENKINDNNRNIINERDENIINDNEIDNIKNKKSNKVLIDISNYNINYFDIIERIGDYKKNHKNFVDEYERYKLINSGFI